METLILVTEVANTVVNPYYTVGYILTAFVAMICACSVVVAGPEVSLKIVGGHFIVAIVMGLFAWNLYLRSSEFSYRVFGYTERGDAVSGMVDQKPQLETWAPAYKITRRFNIR